MIQNGCLRIVLGAYRATPVQVLEAEAEVPSIQLQLDKRVMDACARKGLSRVIVGNDETIIRRLQARRGRKVKPPPTPIQVKDQWALKALGVKTWSEAKTTRVQREGEPPEALSVARGLANIRERIRN